MSGFFCVYIDQFPAWVWEQSTAKLRNKAFVVLERNHVIAASPPALLAGVAQGMTLGKAEARFCASQLSPLPLERVERDSRREELAWREVQRTFYGLTPKVEPIERGFLFAELDGAKALPALRGFDMRGGYAQDRATAHLAAVSTPSATTRTVAAGRERAFADGLRFEELRSAGLSVPTIARLAWFGWKYLGQLRALSRRQLEEQFGAEGTLLFHFAQGPLAANNRRPVAAWKPPIEVVARIEFDLPAREPAEWNGALDELLFCACEGLGTQQAQTLEIEAQTPTTSVLARRVLKEPLADPRVLRRPTESALLQSLKTLLPLPPIVQALTLRLGGLTSAPVQETLFPEDGRERDETLHTTVERLDNRLGARTGYYALLDPHAPLPEDKYHWLNAAERFAHSGKVRRGDK